MISLSNAQFHYEVCICYAYLPWIELPSFEFTISDANLLETRSLSREFTMSSLSITQIHYELTISFAKSLWIHYRFLLHYRFTMNSLSFCQF